MPKDEKIDHHSPAGDSLSFVWHLLHRDLTFLKISRLRTFSGDLITMEPKLAAEIRFINRELSWLEFNQRVLDQALDPSTPLLERVKFFCICGSNLDEFFEVRVAGIKQQIEAEVSERSVDGLTPSENFRAINRRTQRMVDDQYRCWREELRPALASQGIR